MRKWYADAARARDPDRTFLQSRQWREKVRPHHLKQHPLCEHCLLLGRFTQAEQVDHKIRPRGDKLLQRREDNLQSLCGKHHQAKSLWERRREHGSKLPLVIGMREDGYNVELADGFIPLPGQRAETPGRRPDRKARATEKFKAWKQRMEAKAKAVKL